MAEDVLLWLKSCKCQKYDCNHKHAADEISKLRSEVESQRFWAELLASNNCYCSSNEIGVYVVGVCVPCAYRQTIKQNEEARRG